MRSGPTIDPKKELSFLTTVSTAAPIRSGGAKSVTLLKKEYRDAFKIVPWSFFFIKKNLNSGCPVLTVTLKKTSGSSQDENNHIQSLRSITARLRWLLWQVL